MIPYYNLGGLDTICNLAKCSLACFAQNRFCLLVEITKFFFVKTFPKEPPIDIEVLHPCSPTSFYLEVGVMRFLIASMS